MKVVIDTNVLIAIIGKTSSSRWLFDSIISGKVGLCVTNEILLEYGEIIQLKSNSAVSENILNFMIVSPFVERIDVFYRFNLIESDKTDNKFVDCAISANADAIISNDKHFNVLKTIGFPKIGVLTLSEFTKQHQSKIISTKYLP